MLRLRRAQQTPHRRGGQVGHLVVRRRPTPRPGSPPPAAVRQRVGGQPGPHGRQHGRGDRAYRVGRVGGVRRGRASGPAAAAPSGGGRRPRPASTAATQRRRRRRTPAGRRLPASPAAPTRRRRRPAVISSACQATSNSDRAAALRGGHAGQLPQRQGVDRHHRRARLVARDQPHRRSPSRVSRTRSTRAPEACTCTPSNANGTRGPPDASARPAARSGAGRRPAAPGAPRSAPRRRPPRPAAPPRRTPRRRAATPGAAPEHRPVRQAALGQRRYQPGQVHLGRAGRRPRAHARLVGRRRLQHTLGVPDPARRRGSSSGCECTVTDRAPALVGRADAHLHPHRAGLAAAPAARPRSAPAPATRPPRRRPAPPAPPARCRARPRAPATDVVGQPRVGRRATAGRSAPPRPSPATATAAPSSGCPAAPRPAPDDVAGTRPARAEPVPLPLEGYVGRSTRRGAGAGEARRPVDRHAVHVQLGRARASSGLRLGPVRGAAAGDAPSASVVGAGRSGAMRGQHARPGRPPGRCRPRRRAGRRRRRRSGRPRGRAAPSSRGARSPRRRRARRSGSTPPAASARRNVSRVERRPRNSSSIGSISGDVERVADRAAGGSARPGPRPGPLHLVEGRRRRRRPPRRSGR